MQRLIQIWTCLFMLMSLLASGQDSYVPASPYPVTVKQSDGTELTLFAKGNEYAHYPATEDGYSVIRNKKGDYEYALKGAGGNLTPSGFMAKNWQERTRKDARFLERIPKNLSPDTEIQTISLKSATSSKNYPSAGVRKNLLLLIQYPDLPASHGQTEFNGLMNEPDFNGTGSFRDYYLESSNMNLDINTDVFGWFMAEHNYEYYGEKNGSTRARELVAEAIDAAEEAGVDFSMYDNDNDGAVDNLMVVHAGPGAEEGAQRQYIWSHSWFLAESKYYDNVFIGDYIIQPETRTYGMVGIGVFCHEFGHALGLPDLYDRDNSSEGLGEWYLMAYGLWLNQERTPALMSAWCREKLGWIIPEVIPWPVSESHLGSYELNPSATSGDCYKILTPNSNEYFLLENKYKTGFNAAVPGSGLAILHVNTLISHNDDENLKLVDMEEADGRDQLDRGTSRGDEGDLYPGSSGKAVFDDYSYPDARTYDGQYTGINLRDISLNGSVSSFTISIPELPGPNLTYVPSINHLDVTESTVSVQMRVENTGNDPSDSCRVAFYLSETLPATSGILMGTKLIPAIPPDDYQDVNYQKDISTIPSLPLGNYYVGFNIDDGDSVPETDEEDNNYSFDSPQVTHSSLPNMTYNPDMNYLSLIDHTLSVEMEVVNDGNASSGSSQTGYYLSEDQMIDAKDFKLASDSVGVLNAGQSEYKSLTVDLQEKHSELPYGIYYAGFITDDENSVEEEDETDNFFVFTEQPIAYCEKDTTLLQESICEGDSYFFQDEYYTEEGEYLFNLTAGNGCDSTVMLSLTVLSADTTSLFADICSGESYAFGASEYTETGIYETTLTNRDGCDSLVILHLDVLPQSDTLLTAEICQGSSYELAGKAYSQTGVFQAVLQNRFGCDSVVTLDLTVHPVDTTTLYANICSGDTYSFGAYEYSDAGIYETTHMNQYGCDSLVILHLDVLPQSDTLLTAEICQGSSYELAGKAYSQTGVFQAVFQNRFGCDSTVTLELTVLPVDTTTLFAEICSGEAYPVGTNEYAETGIYETTLTNQYGCDSLVILHLDVMPRSDTLLTAEICPGSSYELNGSAYTKTGIYQTVHQNRFGCDSTVTLELTVLPADTTTLFAQICSGESYTFGSGEYTETGIYETTRTNQYGCDSLVILHLDVMPQNDTLLTAEICQGSSYELNGTAYAKTGVYQAVIQNRFGCDSTVTLELTVLPVDTTTLYANICRGETYAVGSNEYAATGVYETTLTNQYGCDSLVILHLDVMPQSATWLSEEICHGETFDLGGTAYTKTGVYQAVIQNRFGCDSTVTLDLTVLPADTTTLCANICHGETYAVGSNEYDATGVYETTLTNQYGCDSLIILRLDVMPRCDTLLVMEINKGDSILVGESIYRESGVYTDILTNRYGCDSLITTELTVKDTISDSSPLKNKDLNVVVYPNPADAYIQIRFEHLTGPYRITLTSSDGKVIFTKTGNCYTDRHIETVSSAEYSRGIYLLSIQAGSRHIFRKVILK